MADDSGNPVVARLYDPVMAVPERTMLAGYRESLASGLSGEVLDIGAGTGAMFPYFDRVDNPIHVTAVEPDPGMRQQAREQANTLGVEIQVVDEDAESLPYLDRSFDAVVGSFVFCTIPDHEEAFSEVARVLDDGGEFRFMEHVRGDGFPGKAHDLLAPCWHAAAGGCTLNRETDRLFLSDDRFRTVEFERNDGLAGTILPIVHGRLVRRRPLLHRVVPSIRF
jgi:SAM-dependent methyltransferase